MPNIVAKFAATLALVAVPAVGVATVTLSASSGTGAQVVADEGAATPTADPTAGKDTTGWQ
ncbi:hypothetical protein STRCI_001058 [Streptomyces cinnabarinus]|uniref:Uncharacterized protein n=1 Tax=Streptomyces cinnabarinus TaxID=67287 RepID=A0ABY7KAK3_9ACTN|nr:hypothetical protein [Streptomyces cinnabarinus]WAZ19969.1 hypothetical protein STRCI_001058 [Streptomyces cinnabarinus]